MASFAANPTAKAIHDQIQEGIKKCGLDGPALAVKKRDLKKELFQRGAENPLFKNEQFLEYLVDDKDIG
jgi:hypothetical protein